MCLVITCTANIHGIQGTDGHGPGNEGHGQDACRPGACVAWDGFELHVRPCGKK